MVHPWKRKAVTVEETELKRKALARRRINILLLIVDLALFLLMIVEVISKISSLA